jgi:hypothetical protein
MRRFTFSVLIAVLPVTIQAVQAPIAVSDLADYRLTADVFRRFVRASRLIAGVTGSDSAFAAAPLFTKDILESGDAPAMATGLVARLEKHAGLAASLRTAKLTAREYATFTIALFTAHLARGFLDAGVLSRVPGGTPADNVAFVRAHQAEVARVLDTLGIAK